MLACSYCEGPGDDSKCRAAEDEVGPLRESVSDHTCREDKQVLRANYLVIGHDESTDQPSDDHYLVDEESEEYRRPWQSRGQQQIQEQEGSRDDPGILLSVPTLYTIGQQPTSQCSAHRR